ncbi:13340_t:CDS:1, partial [Gigaspora margarita]
QSPPHIIERGRPSKRDFMSSIVKEQNQGGTSSRGSYKCRHCGEVDHNAAYHKQKGTKGIDN